MRNRTTMRPLVWACALALCLLSSTGRSAEAGKDDVLRIAVGTLRGCWHPHEATSMWTSRIIRACCEGLVRIDPGTLRPAPGLASTWTTSEDGLTWTFTIREGARWSDGTPVTAGDFAASLRRALLPETSAEYAYLLDDLRGARALSTYGGWADALTPPDGEDGVIQRLEALALRRHGADSDEVRTALGSHPPEGLHDSPSALVRDALRGTRARWNARELRTLITGFTRLAVTWRRAHAEALEGFGHTFGAVAVDARTLRLDLVRRVPWLLDLLVYPIASPLPPVLRKPSEGERDGGPGTMPQTIHACGPYRIVSIEEAPRAFFDGKPISDARPQALVLERNPRYWDAANVRLARIELQAIDDEHAALAAFTDGTVDWTEIWPRETTPSLRKTDLLRSHPSAITYYYVFNGSHPALRDGRVRRALALAVDRERLLKAVPAVGGRPAPTLVPPGLRDGRPSRAAMPFDPKRAAALLREAGHPGGEGIPPLRLLYNTNESHRAIAEEIAAQWAEHLGVQVKAWNMEWISYMAARRAGEFAVVRAGWIPDVEDPYDFLRLFTSGDPNNQSRWSHPAYDALVARIRTTQDRSARLALAEEAETLLLGDAPPLVPIYWYETKALVRPWVRGYRTHAAGKTAGAPGRPNGMGYQPLHGIWVERD